MMYPTIKKITRKEHPRGKIGCRICKVQFHSKHNKGIYELYRLRFGINSKIYICPACIDNLHQKLWKVKK